MAKRIALRHKDSGILKDGFYGYSWTTLFFGFLPALFRGDFLTFFGGLVVSIIAALMTLGFGPLVINAIWACLYNRYYTRKLIERGYVLAGSEGDNAMAASALGIVPPVKAAAA